MAGLTWDRLRTLDAGFRFTPDAGRTFPFRGQSIRVPLLEEVFTSFPNTAFTVEIKPSPHPDFLQTLAAILQIHAPSRTVIACETHRELAAIRRLVPGIPTNLSRPEVREFYFLSKVFLGSCLTSPGRVFQVPVYAGGEDRTGLRVVTRGFVRAAHRTGRPVQVWTVNDPSDIRELLVLGVDGVTTDRPDVLNEVLSARS